MTKRDDLIRLFLEEDAGHCILGSPLDCPACRGWAERLADNVLKVLGVADDPPPLDVKVRKFSSVSPDYEVWLNGDHVGYVHRTGNRWYYRVPMRGASLPKFSTRQQAVDALVAAAVEGNT